MKHPSPWTLEGESVLDRTDEDEGNAAEEARCDHDPSLPDAGHTTGTCPSITLC